MEFRLRPLELSDISTFASYANEFDVAKNMTDGFAHPYTEEHAEKFIKMTVESDPRHIMGIEVDGEICGAAGIHPKEDVLKKNAELGYWVAKKYWGKGIISRVIPKMLDYGFKNFDIERVYARPYGPNKASQRVLEKNGFRLEGEFKQAIYKNGELLDLFEYAILRSEYSR